MESQSMDVGHNELPRMPFAVTIDNNHNFRVKVVFHPQFASSLAHLDGVSFNPEDDEWIVPPAHHKSLQKVLRAMRAESENIIGQGSYKCDLSLDSNHNFKVKTLFDPTITERLAVIPGATFDEARGEWIVPASQRQSLLAIFEDLVAISQRDSLIKPFQEKSIDVASVETKIAPIVESENAYEIDRNAFALNNDSNRSEIAYPNHLDNLAKSLDGVKVIQQGDHYTIEVEYQASLPPGIARIDGVTLNQETSILAASDSKELITRIVNELRTEILADKADRADILSAAMDIAPSAEITEAEVADGRVYTGQILALNDRYVLQNTGRGDAVLHSTAYLSDEPLVNTNSRIAYSNGKGHIKAKSNERSEGMSHSLTQKNA